MTLEHHHWKEYSLNDYLLPFNTVSLYIIFLFTEI